MKCLAVLLLGLTATAAARDVYFQVTLEKLEFTGEKPKPNDIIGWNVRAVVDGEGEAFPIVLDFGNKVEQFYGEVQGITARAKHGQEVKGTLYVSKPDGTLRLPFRISAEAAEATAERVFLKAKA